MRGIAISLLAALWLFTAGPATAVPKNPTPGAGAASPQPLLSACTPYFPYRDGWLGGDAAYSVAMNGGSHLWLFGDSFVAAPDVTTRRGAAMIGNSIAVSQCERGRWFLRYYWRRGTDGPQPFFVPSPAETSGRHLRYWPLGGFRHEGRLYVFLSRVVTENAESLFGFHIEGVDLARIGSLAQPPGAWRITYRPVLRGIPALPGAAVVKRDDYVLLFSPLIGDERPNRPVALTRLTYEALDTPSEGLEYLAADGRWKPGLDPGQARHIFEEGSTELSVHRDARTGLWLAVMNEAAFPADRITLRLAAAPEGPWSSPTAVHVIRERRDGAKTLRSRIFCYAGKAFPPRTSLRGLTLTYACNSTEFGLLLDNMTLYRPRTVLVPLPLEE